MRNSPAGTSAKVMPRLLTRREELSLADEDGCGGGLIGATWAGAGAVCWCGGPRRAVMACTSLANSGGDAVTDQTGRGAVCRSGKARGRRTLLSIMTGTRMLRF